MLRAVFVLGSGLACALGAPGLAQAQPAPTPSASADKPTVAPIAPVAGVPPSSPPGMTAAEAAITQPAAPVAPLTPVARIQHVQLVGALVEGDTERRVLDFLAIDSELKAAGADGILWDEALQSRVRRDLDVLGYTVEPAVQAGAVLVLTLRPMRVVRRIAITGNWPIFEWEILSYLTWRTGYRLPEGDELLAEIRKQERELISFLQRKGYYDATAQFQLRWADGRPEQVDIHIQINLNTGFWRLRYKLGNVTANKLTLLSQNELYNFFDHCCMWVGRTSTERITDDFKRLTDHYQSKGYPGVRLTKREIKPDRSRHAVDIELAVEERKRVSLKFAGRRALSEAELKKAVTIFRDNYYSANELDESARNIYRVYQQQGFFEARVKWHWKNRTGDPIEVQFDIHEGPQLKVREINFAAAEPGAKLHYLPPKLQEQISTRRYPRLGFIGLGEGGFASAIQLEQDVQRLEEFYRHEGYPHPQVSAAVGRSPAALRSAPLLGLQTSLDEGGDSGDSGDLFVRFTIDEGERELVGGLEIQFNGKQHTVSEAQVRKVLQLQPGKPYTADALIADKLRLSDLLKSSGHPYADIDPTRSTWNDSHTQVTLRWILDEHETVRFGPVIIRGNFATRESIIRKDLPFKPGDPYDSRKLREAQQNLEARQIFASVHVLPDPGRSNEYIMEATRKGWPLARNPVPILVEVVERYDYAGDLSAYVGVSTYDSLFSQVSYTWRNLLGTASEAYLQGELGVRVQSLLARYTNPRVFGSFLRFDLRGFWRSENTYSVGLVTSYGANAELTHLVTTTDEQGRRLPPTLRLFTRLEFNISQILVPLYRTQGLDVPFDGDRTQSLKWTFGVELDKRVGFEAPGLRLRNQPVPPNPLRPASGYLLAAQVTGAVCCGASADGSFVALAGRAVLLQPFGPELKTEDGWIYGMKRFKLNLNLRLNYGIPLSRSALPVVERYFAGGDSSTRGYDNDALRSEEVRSPLGPLGGEPAYRIVPQGGSARILSQIEYEFAITPKLLGWPWVGAVFVDTGAVFDGWDKLRWNDVRFSAGISLLRLHTQFGALSLDYAYPLTLPGQDPLLQTDRWKREDWYQHFPGRIHFNWGMNISL